MSENGSLKANESAELGGSSSSSSSTGSDGEVQAVDDAAESEDVGTYEGVASDDFAAYSEMVEIRLDAITASSVVIVFALFLCAGILAVGTLVRSIELWK